MSYNNANIIQEKKKEIETIKTRLYMGKRKRLKGIDGFLNKIEKELNKRKLTDIPTPTLAKLYISFSELAIKEYPTIEVEHIEGIDPLDNFSDYKRDRVIF